MRKVTIKADFWRCVSSGLGDYFVGKFVLIFSGDWRLFSVSSLYCLEKGYEKTLRLAMNHNKVRKQIVTRKCLYFICEEHLKNDKNQQRRDNDLVKPLISNYCDARKSKNLKIMKEMSC